MSEILGEITSFMMSINGRLASATLKHPIKVYKGRKIRLPLYLQKTIQDIILAMDTTRPTHLPCDSPFGPEVDEMGEYIYPEK